MPRGFYNAKKERFVDDKTNKQRQYRKYSMLKNDGSYFEFLSVEPEDGE